MFHIQRSWNGRIAKKSPASLSQDLPSYFHTFPLSCSPQCHPLQFPCPVPDKPGPSCPLNLTEPLYMDLCHSGSLVLAQNIGAWKLGGWLQFPLCERG